MSENPRCADPLYPSLGDCEFDVALPQEPSRIQAWHLVLSTDSYPDYPFPDDLGDGFVAIVWSGEVAFSGEGPGCEVNGQPHRAVGLTNSTVVSLTGGERAEIAILGLVGSAEPSFDSDRVCASVGLTPDFGPSNDRTMMTVIMRVLDLDCPEIEVEAQSWDRPAYVLTTQRGPRPNVVTNGPRLESTDLEITEADCAADIELRLVSVPGFTSLRFLPGRPSNDMPAQQHAILCDFFVDGDTIFRPLGCSWRCKGGA